MTHDYAPAAVFKTEKQRGPLTSLARLAPKELHGLRIERKAFKMDAIPGEGGKLSNELAPLRKPDRPSRQLAKFPPAAIVSHSTWKSLETYFLFLLA